MLRGMRFTGVWRDYQARVLDEMERHFDDGRLHVVAAPGAGKTVLGLEIIRRIGRPALIFSPTIAIREQWLQRLCPLFLDEPPLPSSISRDIADPRELTLSTYQALDSFRRSERLDEVIGLLESRGPLTLVLDEAHHLRREWWHCLERLASALGDLRIVALTATPPYDASFAEWARYEKLCGSIDLEIGIPELVRNGDLCPHQDHVILSEPTADALSLLERRRLAVADLDQTLRSDEPLLDYLQSHPWLADPETHVEQILDAPEMLSAILVLLGAAGRKIPTAPLNLLGVSARDMPPPSDFWLERFLDGALFRHASIVDLGDDRSKELRSRLQREGLIEGGRVRLLQGRSVFRLLTSSLAKLDSITEIVRAEHAILGDRLRMVILSDHIRAGELPAKAADTFHPAKLGVIPIFETLRRADISNDRLGVLTGSLVILPRSILAAIARAAAGIHLAADSIRIGELPGCPSHVELGLTEGGSANLVRLVTLLFASGEIEILVGTQSLLGEGWDAPVLNSLILASNTASFMLSNQMRGRAIRIDSRCPDKVANIWHLATIDPSAAAAGPDATNALNWGYLNDGDLDARSDMMLLQRRFRAFEGVTNGASNLIESGIGRLGLDAVGRIDDANKRSFAVAADRAAIALRWSESLGEGSAQARVRETAAPNYAPRQLSWFDTLHALVWSAAGSGLFAAANELRHMGSMHGIGLAGMGLAGAITIASLPRLAKGARLVWRNGSLEGSLEAVGMAVLKALHHIGVVADEEMEHGRFEVRSSIDGRKDIVIAGVKRDTERQIMQAIAEILGPVQNPRYLLVRHSWFGFRRRTDYHAVPTVLGATKVCAEHFATTWAASVGTSNLIYTRTVAGRRTLLRARARSFAAGFQRAVDRRSVWL